MAQSDTEIDVYDLRGLNCPLPVLKAKKRLSTMESGTRLFVETTDPLAVIDVPNFCREAGHLLLDTQTLEDGAGHKFLIERG